MEYRQLGSAGVRVSVIGLGTNRFGAPTVPQAEVNSIIDAALERFSIACTVSTGHHRATTEAGWHEPVHRYENRSRLTIPSPKFMTW